MTPLSLEPPMRAQRLSLNLSPRLIQALRKQADSHHRSLSGEVTYLLKPLVKPAEESTV